MSRIRFSISLLMFAMAGAIGCAGRGPRPEPPLAMRLQSMPALSDDLELKGLKESIADHIDFLGRREDDLPFGAVTVARQDYLLALKELKYRLESQGSVADFLEFVKKRFDCFAVHGDGRWGEVFITSYFDPILTASRSPTAKLSQPLYAVPPNMVLIELDSFRQTFSHLPIFAVTEQKSAAPVARGRWFERGGVKLVVPYYSRFEIDTLGLLRGRAPVLAYVDPIEAFILQIQGSGTLKFADGSLVRVGYAAQNGHPYVAIGKFLTDRIPLAEMSLGRIESVLRAMPPDIADEIMSRNPSYVFLTKIRGEPKTTLGTPVRAGRTIATDPQYFPKGVLAYLEFNRPRFTSAAAEEVAEWQPVGRLVMDQDTGGAIRGTGRLDLYWGRGDEARQAAGVMKQWGRLCYLAPKSDWLKELKEGQAP